MWVTVSAGRVYSARMSLLDSPFSDQPRRDPVDVIALCILGVVMVLNDFIYFSVGGWSCDETCTYASNHGNPTDVPWREAADSWQWDALVGLSVASFLALMVGVIAFLGRWPRPLVGTLLVTSVVLGVCNWLIAGPPG